MSSNFFIWTAGRPKRNACSYYRIDVPMRSIMKQDLAEVFVDDGTRGTDEMSQIAFIRRSANAVMEGQGAIHA